MRDRYPQRIIVTTALVALPSMVAAWLCAGWHLLRLRLHRSKLRENCAGCEHHTSSQGVGRCEWHNQDDVPWYGGACENFTGRTS